jgi:16S rRNA (cytosine967-C5)-methyltransferase
VFASWLFGPKEDRLSAEDRAGLKTRRLAVALLVEVLTRRRPLDEALELAANDPSYAEVEPRDRAFARAIVATTLRRRGQLTDIVKSFIEKPLPEKRGRLDAILLSAAAQLVFLKTPPHAVINLAVFLTREDGAARRFHKLVNAVLRRVAEKGEAIALRQDAGKLNTPGWLWGNWAEGYGLDVASRIAQQHLAEPPLDLTVKSDPEGWAARLGGIALPNGSVRMRTGGRIEEIDGFEAGDWWVQDAAASLPAKLLGDVREKRVADLCAAPGGKTAQLASAGGRVTAVDSSEKRMKRLGENLTRLKLDAETVTADLLHWQPPSQFDAILLDAPCSATGTIRRNPDIPYLKSAPDIGQLCDLQRKMLTRALDWLRPGGVLVYCTCSLELAEGPGQTARILEDRPELRLVPVEPHEVGGRPDWIDDDGALRTLPHYLQLSDPELSGMDGFYAVRFVKPA